jgi:Leucine-rich repeat (LRR) protein
MNTNHIKEFSFYKSNANVFGDNISQNYSNMIIEEILTIGKQYDVDFLSCNENDWTQQFTCHNHKLIKLVDRLGIPNMESFIDEVCVYFVEELNICESSNQKDIETFFEYDSCINWMLEFKNYIFCQKVTNEILIKLNKYAPIQCVRIVDGHKFSNSCLHDLQHLKKLKIESFYRICEEIGSFMPKKLEELEIFGSNITNDDIKNMLSLKKLTLTHTKVTGEGIKYLTNLKSLCITGIKNITENNMKNLFLTELYAFECEITDACIMHMVDMEVLICEPLYITDAAIKLFPKLKCLNISKTQITGQSIQNHAMIEELYADDNCFITDDIVKKMVNLKTLSVSKTKITDDGIKNLKHIVELNISETSGESMTDEGIKNLTTLKILRMKKMQLISFGVDNLVNLTELDANDTKICDKNIEKLINLKKLLMDFTNVSDEGLKKLTKLTELSASMTKISNNGIKNLVNLTNLNVNFTCIDNDGLTNLKKLNMLRGWKTGVTMDIKKILPKLKQHLMDV